MKIAILARANYVTLQRHAQNLTKLGHDVTIITLHRNNIEASYEVRSIRFPKILSRFKLHYLFAMFQVWRVVKQVAPDLIDCHGASSYGLFALLPWNAPVVLTIYGPDLYVHAKQSRIVRAYIKQILQKVDGVWGSLATKSLTQEFVGVDISEKLWINSWGVPKAKLLENAENRRISIRHEFGVDEDIYVVLHSRRMHPFWRVEILIDAIPKILVSNPRTEFWFAYPNTTPEEQTYLEMLQGKIADLGCEQAVRWVGYNPHYLMISLMHASDVYVCIGENDMLSSSVQESMVTGLVPVLVNLYSYQEVIENKVNGFLLDEVDKDSLANLMNAVLQNFDEIQPRVSKYNQQLFSSGHDQESSTLWLVDKYREIIDMNKSKYQ